MKLRREPRGLHFYDRTTGVHALIDECPVPKAQCDEGPEVVSIALTNACDLECSFCYAPKTPHTLDFEEVLGWCLELDSLGTLEVAFGGGEPTLFKGLADLCKAIWAETQLGISITTHGHHLTSNFISHLSGCISIIRFSIDAPEPVYSDIRKRSLKRVLQLAEEIPMSIPLGVNTVVNYDTIGLLDQTLRIVTDMGALDWLLLPETSQGRFTLSDREWAMLDAWIQENRSKIGLRITYDAKDHLSCPTLFADQTFASSYLHIGADRMLRRCSYERAGVPLHGNSILKALNTLESRERANNQTTYP